MTSEPIEVLLSTDGNYFQHMAVVIFSLLENNKAHRFNLTIVLDKRHPDDERRLGIIIDGHGNARCKFCVFDMERLSRFPLGLHFTPAIYVRLFATEFYPAEVERVLWLDADLVVNADIGELWNTPFDGKALAAAPDVFIDIDLNPAPELWHSYFNSGVLLINMTVWRTEDAAMRFVEYINAHMDTLLFPDQDTLNEVFRGRVHPLAIKWNYSSAFAQIDPAHLRMSRSEFNRLRRRPGIVHYTSSHKPWFFMEEVHYKHLYYSYLRRTPWRDYRPSDLTLANRIKKLRSLARLKRLGRWHFPAVMRLGRRLAGIAPRVGR